MAKYWISVPRYLKQKGQAEPAYVEAHPMSPAIVDMPDDFKPPVHAKDWRPVDEGPPEKPLPAHAPPATGQVKTAPQRMDPATGGKRLADR
jgi:hypothetical protein